MSKRVCKDCKVQDQVCCLAHKLKKREPFVCPEARRNFDCDDDGSGKAKDKFLVCDQRDTVRSRFLGLSTVAFDCDNDQLIACTEEGLVSKSLLVGTGQAGPQCDARFLVCEGSDLVGRSIPTGGSIDCANAFVVCANNEYQRRSIGSAEDEVQCSTDQLLVCDQTGRLTQRLLSFTDAISSETLVCVQDQLFRNPVVYLGASVNQNTIPIPPGGRVPFPTPSFLNINVNDIATFTLVFGGRYEIIFTATVVVDPGLTIIFNLLVSGSAVASRVFDNGSSTLTQSINGTIVWNGSAAVGDTIQVSVNGGIASNNLRNYQISIKRIA